MGYFELISEVISLIIELVGVLAWPAVALVAICVIKPQKLVEKLIADGGQVSAVGVSVNVPAKIAELADSVGDLRVSEEEQKLAKYADEMQASDTPGALYDRIITAWGELAEAMWRKLRDERGVEISLRAPRQLIESLLDAGLVKRKVGEELERLLDIRNLVKRNGVAGFEALGLSEEDTLKYAASAAAIKNTHFL